MNDVQQMEALMLQMSVPNTQIVKEAERQISQALKDKGCLPVLFQLLRGSGHVSVRQLGAVLLRLSLPKLWGKLDPETRNVAKQLLLECLVHEQERIVALNTTYVISSVARQEFDESIDGWRELLDLLVTFARSQDTRQQEIAMWVFYAITETIGKAFQPHFADLKQLYSSVLTHSSDNRVKIAALKASTALLDFLSSGEEVLEFRELIPLLLKGLEENMTDETLAVQILQVLSQIAEKPVPILNKAVGPVLKVLMTMLHSNHVDIGTKKVTIDTLCTILAYKSRIVAKLNVLNPLLETALVALTWDYPRFVQVLTEKELSQEQLNARHEEGDSNDEEELCDFGQSLISAIATHLPARKTFEPIMRIAFQKLQVQTPFKGVHADGVVPDQWLGLALLLYMTEGLAEEIVEQGVVGELLNWVKPITEQSPDPINRATALLCLAEWVQYLSPPITQFMPSILSTAMVLLDDRDSVFVRLCAGDVIEIICDDIEEEMLLPFANQLTDKLLSLCECGVNANVQSTALNALASVMVTCGARYMPYFDRTCALLGTLATVSDAPLLSVRGHAMYALGTLALTASREDDNGNNNLARFQPLVPAILSNAVESVNFDDMEVNRLTYAALGNLSDALGEDVAPFVETIVDVLLASQYLDEDGQIDVKDVDGALVPESVRQKFGQNGQVNGDAYEDAIEGEEEDAEYQPGVRYEYCIRTEVVEAKQSAIHAIGRVAENAPSQSIMEHLEKMLDVCLRTLDHIYPSLRSTAAEATGSVMLACSRCYPLPPLAPELQKAAQDWAESCFLEPEESRKWLPGLPARTGIAPQMIKLLNERVLPPLFTSITEEREEAVAAACCDTLANLVLHLGPACFGTHLEELLKACVEVFKDSASCQLQDYDGEEDEDDEQDDERNVNEVFESACDLVTAIAQACGPSFAPYIPTVFEELVSRMGKGAKRKAASLRVFNLVLAAQGPGGAAPFLEQLIRVTLFCLVEESPLVRQNAAFLMGQLVFLGGEEFAKDSESLFQLLKSLEPLLAEAGPAAAEAQECTESGREFPFEVTDKLAMVDNACSAVCRILAASLPSGSLPAGQIFNSLVEILPIRFDMMENYPVFRCINMMLLTPASQENVLNHTSALVSIIGQSLVLLAEESDSHPFTLMEIKKVLQMLLSKRNSQAMQAMHKMPAEQTEQIQELLQ